MSDSIPGKAALDAETDQALAWIRDARTDRFSPVEAAVYGELAGVLASQIGEQFPGIPAGRVVMAVMQGLSGILIAMRELGLSPSPAALLTISALAAEQLTREAAS